MLDLGCGNGAKLMEFYKRGYEVWGVDVSEQAIDLCERLLPEGHFRVGEIGRTGLPSGHFHCIRIDNALEHVPDPCQAIRESYRLLCGKGKLMIYVPHGKSLTMRIMKAYSISSWIPFHLQLFTRGSLHKLMEEAGFTHIRIYDYTPTSWLPLSVMQWSSRRSPAANHDFPGWVIWAYHPIGWIATKLGLGEELFATGTKS
jgi:ubiquinone/menaquinone biosynthesis C-methylase UbiE